LHISSKSGALTTNDEKNCPGVDAWAEAISQIMAVWFPE
jgi:hypothetical protein